MQIKPSTGSASIPKYKMSLNIKLSYAARISLRAGSEEKKSEDFSTIPKYTICNILLFLRLKEHRGLWVMIIVIISRDKNDETDIYDA